MPIRILNWLFVVAHILFLSVPNKTVVSLGSETEGAAVRGGVSREYRPEYKLSGFTIPASSGPLLTQVQEERPRMPSWTAVVGRRGTKASLTSLNGLIMLVED